jgi:hypothetical protein
MEGDEIRWYIHMLEHLRDADLIERKSRMKNTGPPRVGAAAVKATRLP